MTRFESFDNLEDMLSEIQSRAEEAMKHLHPTQKTIVAGDYVVCPHEELKLLIFGKTFTDEEIFKGEMNAGASADEAAYTLGNLGEARLRGYYFGRWHSTACPEGEFGDQHLSRMWPITKAEFELAQANDWVMPTPELVAMLARFFPETKGGDDDV